MESQVDNQIKEYERLLKEKDVQIDELLNQIENLEETIIKREEIINLNEETLSKGDNDDEIILKKKNLKLSLYLEEQEKNVRDLKNRMGFLRKDNIQLQQKIESIEKKDIKSSTIIPLIKKERPLEALVKDLQTKINK